MWQYNSKYQLAPIVNICVIRLAEFPRGKNFYFQGKNEALHAYRNLKKQTQKYEFDNGELITANGHWQKW